MPGAKMTIFHAVIFARISDITSRISDITSTLCLDVAAAK